MAGGEQRDGVGAGVVAGAGVLGAGVAEPDGQQVGGRARPRPAEQLALLGARRRRPGEPSAGRRLASAAALGTLGALGLRLGGLLLGGGPA